MKKIKIVVLTVIAGLLFFAGANFAVTQVWAAKKKVTLSIVESSYWKRVWYDKITDAFQERYPNIGLDIWWGANWREYVKTKIAAGECPDVMGSPTVEYLDAELIMCLDDALETPAYGQPNVKWKDSFYKAALEDCKYKGRYWSVPFDMSTDGYIWYNVDMFKKYGFMYPKTWSEFLNLCAKFKTKGITPLAQSNDKLYINQWWRMLSQRIAGLDKIHATGSCERQPGNHWTDSPFLKAAKMAVELADKGYFQLGYEGTNYQGAQMTFIQKRAAMMLIGNWLAGEMSQWLPKDLHLDYVRFPVVEGGKGDPTVQIAGASNMCLSAKTKYPKEAILYLKFFSSREMMHQMATDSHLLYGTIGANAPDNMTEFDKKAIKFIKEAPRIFEWYAPPDFAPTDEIGYKMFEGTVGLMLKQISPEKFLEKMENLMVEWEQS